MKTTSDVVQFCGGDADICQITAYVYGSAAVWLKTFISGIVRVNNDGASVS